MTVLLSAECLLVLHPLHLIVFIAALSYEVSLIGQMKPPERTDALSVSHLLCLLRIFLLHPAISLFPRRFCHPVRRDDPLEQAHQALLTL